MISYSDIVAARKRISDAIYFSPCPESVPLSELVGCHVFCKLEYLQRTGSFKERGAANALMGLSDDQRCRGVIAASAGNHALALAYHGQRLGIPVTVVMPRFAPLIKVTTCRRLGARIVQEGDGFEAARAKADQLAVAENLTLVHGFDDPAIIAGQGTIGLEVLEQVPDLDAIIVPVGGGGLIAGIALAIKHVRPEVKIIGVEPTVMACFSASRDAGRRVAVAPHATLADGLAVGQPGEITFTTVQPLIDRMVTVSEDVLALAILRLMEMEKSVVEGAGAAALAALMSGQCPELAGKRVVLLLSGGNIDPAIISRVIEHGMVVDGRLWRFTAVISDRPGGLERLTRVIAASGASVRDIAHDRAFSGADFSAVRVVCTVETMDRDHIGRLQRALLDAGIVTLSTDGCSGS